MIINTTYGEGGYDPNKPNNNIVETVDRINSQECLVTEYDGDNIINQETLVTPEMATQDISQYTIPAAAIDTLVEAMDDPAVNSISEIKLAVLQFVRQIKG